MSRSRPFKDHQTETLHVLRDSPNVGKVAKRNIEVELNIRQQLASLDPEERLEKPRASKGTRPEDRMNKTEARYAHQLDARVQSGFYAAYYFEHFKLRVGVERDWYTVDFLAVRPDGLLDAIEVKGPHIHEDAIEKFKAAALLYPWIRWVMVQQKGKGEPWEIVYQYDRKVHSTEEETDAESNGRHKNHPAGYQ